MAKAGATKSKTLTWTHEDFAADAEKQYEKRVLVDAGAYETVVSACEWGTSKAGTPKLVFEFSIRGGKFSGEKLSKHVPTQGKGAGIARQVLLAFHDEDELVGGFEVDPVTYMGERAIIVVKRGEFTNEYGTFPSADVDRVLRASDEEARAKVAETAAEQGE